MIDKILGYDENGYAIYSSDIYNYENYIGYEDEKTKKIILYGNKKRNGKKGEM